MERHEDFSPEYAAYASYYDDLSYTLRVDKSFQQQTQQKDPDDLIDIVGVVFLYATKGGKERLVAEYNYFLDRETSDSHVEDCSAIYPVVIDEQGDEVIEWNESCREYHIDFNNPNWKWDLFKAMVDFHKEIEPQFMAA